MTPRARAEPTGVLRPGWVTGQATWETRSGVIGARDGEQEEKTEELMASVGRLMRRG